MDKGEINRNDTQTINKNYNLNITTNAEALETELQQIQLDSPTT